MNNIVAIYIFVIGMSFGSFALAVADREIAGKSWIRGRSSCDSCNKKLGVRDLIPVLSWIYSRGRCRYCKAKLSVIYPVAEIVMGVTFLLSYSIANTSTLSGTFQIVLWLLALAPMMILLIIDARTYILPYKFIAPVIVLGLVHASITVLISSSSFVSALLLLSASLGVSSGIFAIIYFASKAKMIGDSDVLFGLAMGLFLATPQKAWLALFIASISGLCFGLVYAVARKKQPTMKLKIPFGPHLIIGLYMSYVFGQLVIDWYIQNLG
jgi:leader peptidase (prepilin peptidase)/N-methyltransferase